MAARKKGVLSRVGSAAAQAIRIGASTPNAPWMLRSIDGFVSALSAAGGFSGGYAGARIHRGNSDWSTMPRSVRQELLPAVRALRARGRDLEKNNPYAQSFLTLLDTLVVGPEGIHVKAQVRDSKGDLDKRINGILDEAWNDWATRPVTLDRKLNLTACLWLIQRSEAVDGELLVRHIHRAANPFGYAVQLIDADMLDEQYQRARGPEGNEIRMSVEVDEFGAPLGYHVWDRPDAYAYPSGGPRKFIPAWDPFTRMGEAMHPHEMSRISQTRGVTWFHAVMQTMDDTGAYTEAALTGAKQNAASTLLIKSGDETPDQVMKNESTPTEKIELSPAMAYRLQKGDEPFIWEPKQDQLAQLPSFLKEMGRQTAMGTGAHGWMLTHDLEATSFSSLRGSLVQMKPYFRMKQERLIALVLRPIREAWLKNAILTGAIKLPSIDPTRYMAARYRGPRMPFMNLWEEARGTALMLGCGLTSRQRVLAETTGEDWDEVAEDLAHEKEEAKRLDLNIDPPPIYAGATGEAIGAEGGTASTGSGGGSRTSDTEVDVPASVRARMNGRGSGHTNGATR